MPIHSRLTVPIPSCSLQQWIFGSATSPLPDYRALIDADRPSTYYLTLEDYRLLAKRVALGLLDPLGGGVRAGDRVLVFSGNTLLYAPVFLGILMAGAVFTGANPGFVARELAYQIADSGAVLVLAAEQGLDVALEAVQMAGLRRDRVFVLDSTPPPPSGSGVSKAVPKGDSKGTPRHWHELVASVDQATSWSWSEPADPATAPCCLNYSSGTTGVPKGVVISHRSYVANGVGVVHVQQQRGSEAAFEAWRARQRVLCFLPLYHAYGQTMFIANFPTLRVPVYVMSGPFDFLKMLAHVQRFRITLLVLVPPIVVALAKHPATRKVDLTSIETIGCGAAPLSAEVAREAELVCWPPTSASLTRQHGDERIVRQGWGMTEVTCTCLAWDPRVRLRGSPSVGELMPGCAARIMNVSVSPPVEITQPNVTGELWVTGPTLMLGYHGAHNAKANEESIVVDTNTGTRWLRTGDIAFFEAPRPIVVDAATGETVTPGPLFHIVDRLKELIKVRGNQVAPAELEALLLEREDVADACVVGVVIGGEEVPRAYLVPAATRKEKSGGEDDVAAWIAARVAPFKRLRGGVRWVNAIPKNPVSAACYVPAWSPWRGITTPKEYLLTVDCMLCLQSGKILRNILREQAKREVGDKAPPASKLA